MNIETKYGIGQTVWYPYMGRIETLSIFEFIIWKSAVYFRIDYRLWDDTNTHWQVHEHLLYATIEEAKESVEVEG